MHLLLYSEQSLTVTGAEPCSTRHPDTLFKEYRRLTTAPIWASQELQAVCMQALLPG